MYASVAEKYVGDDDVRAFLKASNPWALRAITERLLEAAERGLWAAPGEGALDGLREAYLDVEGDLEETLPGGAS
jgi:cobaltochelatase CobN